MDKKLVKTTDEKTAQQLIEAGFKLISNIGNMYTFLNDMSNVKFDAIDTKKIVYDNKLSL